MYDSVFQSLWNFTSRCRFRPVFGETGLSRALVTFSCPRYCRRKVPPLPSLKLPCSRRHRLAPSVAYPLGKFGDEGNKSNGPLDQGLSRCGLVYP
jgi:hypothetical protein